MEEEEYPLRTIKNLLRDRVNEQKIRGYLLQCFPNRLPSLFRPQPSVITTDRFEELVIHHRAEFLNAIYDLCLICESNPAQLQ
jgi:hypothetical protein